MSGLTLKCLDQDADRISVQSNCSVTWVPERRKYRWMPAKQHDVAVQPDEVIILKTRAPNRIVLTARGGDLYVQSTRRATLYLRPEKPLHLSLVHDETLIIRSPTAKDPTRGHRIPTADEIAEGFTP